MTNDYAIEQLENWAEPMLKSLEKKQRRELMRKIVMKVRKSNQDRMKRQEHPDGTPWTPRKKESRLKRVHKSVEFLYDKGGRVEKRRLTNWRSTKEMMTGYDPDAGGIRSFRKDRVEKYIDIKTTSAKEHRLRSKKGGIKRMAMFTKLRTTKHLKTTTTDESAGLVFRGRAAEIARVHHFGRNAPVYKGGPDYKYPQRELLGLTRKDLEMIADEIMEHVSP